MNNTECEICYRRKLPSDVKRTKKGYPNTCSSLHTNHTPGITRDCRCKWCSKIAKMKLAYHKKMRDAHGDMCHCQNCNITPCTSWIVNNARKLGKKSR